MANPTRHSKQADLATLVHDRHRLESLAHDDQLQERLCRLETFIRQMANTDQGRKDLQLRNTLLGPCRPAVNETPAVFYGRLRRWLDQDLTGHVRRVRREALTSR